MGGSIAITIREPNGTIHKKGVWTNPLPNMLKDIRIHKKDMNYIKKELLDWNSDYHTDLLAPLTYGLIVIDLQTNHFVECNNYSQFQWVDGVSLSNDMKVSNKGDYGYTLGGELYYKDPKDAFYDDEYADACAKLRPWLWEGRVKAYLWDRKEKQQILINESPTIEQIIEANKEYLEEGSIPRYTSLLCDMQFSLEWSPEWNYISYRGKKGFHQLRAKIEELGFVLTDEEKQAWDDYFE